LYTYIFSFYITYDVYFIVFHSFIRLVGFVAVSATASAFNKLQCSLFIEHLLPSISLCNQPPRPTQPSTLRGIVK